VVTKVGAHVRDQRSVKGYKVGLHFALVPRFRLVSHLPLIQKPVSYNKDLPTFLFDGKQMFAGESQAEVEARKQVGKISHPSKNNKQATTFIEIDNTDPHTSTAPLPTLERYGGLFFACGTTNDTWPSLQHDSSWQERSLVSQTNWQKGYFFPSVPCPLNGIYHLLLLFRLAIARCSLASTTSMKTTSPCMRLTLSTKWPFTLTPWSPTPRQSPM